MAKVVSLFKISGTISDLTIRQTKDGQVAQMKPGPSRESVLHNERFRVTRMNAREFELAVKEGKLLRSSLGTAMNGMRVASLNGRMNGLFYKVAMSDTEHRLGSRYASNGNMQLLAGFDFNKDLSLDNALPVKFSQQLDVGTGTLKVEVPSFIARKRKGFPAEATHFCIVSGGTVIDFTNRLPRNNVQVSELLPLRKKTPEPICFEHVLKTERADVLVQVLGMQFYKVVDGEAELLQGGAMQVLEAVRVEEGNKALRQGGNEGEGNEGIEALRQQGNEGEEGNEATRHKGNEEGRQEGNEGLEMQGNEVLRQRGNEGVQEGGMEEMPLVAEDGCPPVVVAGTGRAVERLRRRGRGGAGLRSRMRGGKRLQFCRASEDLHYICNPSDGKHWLPVSQEDAGTPGCDP